MACAVLTDVQIHVWMVPDLLLHHHLHHLLHQPLHHLTNLLRSRSRLRRSHRLCPSLNLNHLATAIQYLIFHLTYQSHLDLHQTYHHCMRFPSRPPSKPPTTSLSVMKNIFVVLCGHCIVRSIKHETNEINYLYDQFVLFLT